MLMTSNATRKKQHTILYIVVLQDKHSIFQDLEWWPHVEKETLSSKCGSSILLFSCWLNMLEKGTKELHTSEKLIKFEVQEQKVEWLLSGSLCWLTSWKKAQKTSIQTETVIKLEVQKQKVEWLLSGSLYKEFSQTPCHKPWMNLKESK